MSAISFVQKRLVQARTYDTCPALRSLPFLQPQIRLLCCELSTHLLAYLSET